VLFGLKKFKVGRKKRAVLKTKLLRQLKPHRVDLGFVIGLAKDGAASHKGVRASRSSAGDVVGLDAAVNF
jgi:hypothetical protein